MPKRESKTSTVPVVWATFGIFSLGTIQMISCRERLVTMHGTWLCHYDPETKQQSMEWRHSDSPRPKISECKIPLENSRLDFLWSRRHPPHWLSSKGPNYQRGVLAISVGAIEGHFEGKTRWEGHQGVLFLHDNAPAHWALATQKKLAHLGFQCLDHPPYSPHLAPSDYHLSPGLKKQLKGRHFSSEAEVIAAAETWLDGQPSEIVLTGLQKLEQRTKKCIEHRGEYVE